MKIFTYTLIIILLLFSFLTARPNALAAADSKLLIRKVIIHGGHPYLTKKIQRLSSLQTGDTFSNEQLEESKERIEDFFSRDGYINTQVDIKATPDKKAGFINILINIHKGSHHRIGDIKLTGNTHLKDKYFKNKIGRQSRYSPARIKKKLKKIETKYVNKGFIRNRVKVTESKYNPQTDKVDLSLEINERKQLHVSFSGNKWFHHSSLLSQTTFEKESAYDKEAVKNSADQIKLFYLLNGFLNAKVFYNSTNKEHDIFVTYLIEEGPRTRLKQIILNGLKDFSKSDALDGIASATHSLTRQGFYIENPIEGDLTIIANNYQQNGFFDFRIINTRTEFNSYRDLATLIIDLSEGPRYKISEFSLDGNNNADTTELKRRATFKLNKYYNAFKINQTAEKIIKYYQSEGYPLVSIKSEELIHTESQTVSIKYHINEGPQVRIRHIILEGIYATKPAIVLEAVKLSEGQFFRYTDLLKGQLNLKRMDLFDHVSVTPIGLSEDSNTTDILVRLIERKRTTLDLQAGFDSDKLANGELILTQRNIFGLGKHIQIKGIGGFELSRGELNFISPRLFGASWNLLNQYFVQYEDAVNFNAFSYGGSVGALKHFGRDWTLLLKSQINRFNLVEEASNTTALKDNLFDNTFAELLASVAYDSRDNYADPRSGFYSVASTELDTDLSQITNDFVILKLSTSHYLTFFKNVTLSNSLRIGYINVLTDGTRIPATKLFFMGGNDTVRGFDEDAIRDSGGTKSLIYNTELGFRINSSFQVAGFADFGSLTDTFEDINRESIRGAAGAGLRYITPVGPIRMDYGFILDRKPGEPMGRFHFTFGYFF